MKNYLANYLKHNPKKYLIFDFDHTLFTLHLPWGEHFDKIHQILRKYNSNFYNQHQHKEDSSFELINRFTREFGTEIRDKTLEYACKFEKDQLTGVTEQRQLTDFILENKAKYKFFLWTSNCTSTVKPILKDAEIHDFFEKIVGRDSVTYTKPDPDGFASVTEDLEDFKKSEFLMIGDSSADERAAHAAGIDFLEVYT